MDSEEIERVRLFVPCNKRPMHVSVEHEWIENPHDGSFARSFLLGTVDKLELSKIDNAIGALILYCPFDLNEGRKKALTLVTSLRKQGALAVRVEQSKVGWEVNRWIEMISSNNSRDIHRAVVVMLTGNNKVQSCGMHAFSLPDAMVSVNNNEPEMHELLTVLNIYQIFEDPIILTGQTFRIDPETPKRRLERWPDDNYPENEICHNPFGVWRVGPPGGQAQPQLEFTPVFVPSLVSILTALEQKDKCLLTREQVEKIRDESACISLNHRDAQKLERSRGYFDIEPTLAWEQWQVIRSSQ